MAAGIYLNPVNFAQWSQLRAFILAADEMPDFTLAWYAARWGYCGPRHLAGRRLHPCAPRSTSRRSKPSHAWAAQARGASEQKDAPLYALVLPIVPVVLNIAFDFSVIGGFVIAGFAALFLCGQHEGHLQRELPAGQQAVL